MERNINTFINLVIPTSLLGDSRLTFLERLLLIDILSLCKKKGYCWATNEYFKNLFNVSKQTISKSISSLSKYGYIVLEYDKKEKIILKEYEDKIKALIDIENPTRELIQTIIEKIIIDKDKNIEIIYKFCILNSV